MNKRIDTILDFVLILSSSIFFPKPSLHGCEFSSFSSGSKVRVRREMPTSGPGGVSATKGLFRWCLSPRKRLSYSLRPAFEDATDGKEKNHASAVCRVSRSLAHLSSTVLDPAAT